MECRTGIFQILVSIFFFQPLTCDLFAMTGKTVTIQRPSALTSPSNSQGCLIHIYPTGPAMGSRYSLDHNPTVLGRENDCQIVIEDESVSRRHASIQMEEDGYTVKDLQSTNGTFVNEARVSTQKLKDGDYLH